MIYNLALSPEAYREIELAECYFKAKGIERLFLEDLDKQFQYLEKFPLSRQIRYRNIRIHLLEIYNYSIHYTVKTNNVFVIHILNQNQNF